MKRPVAAAVAILLAWMLVDLLMHRMLLAPLYEASAALWRPFDQMSVPLIYAATALLIGAFVGVYALLVRPKSLRAGLALGALLGVALGVCSGLGTYIHMPIPATLAWGWFAAACLKGLAAGGIMGALIVERRPALARD